MYLNAEIAFYKADHHLQVVGRADSCDVGQLLHLEL